MDPMLTLHPSPLTESRGGNGAGRRKRTKRTKRKGGDRRRREKDQVEWALAFLLASSQLASLTRDFRSMPRYRTCEGGEIKQHGCTQDLTLTPPHIHTHTLLGGGSPRRRGERKNSQTRRFEKCKQKIRISFQTRASVQQLRSAAPWWPPQEREGLYCRSTC